MIIPPVPGFGREQGFPDRVKRFFARIFTPQTPIETFVEAISTPTAWLNVNGLISQLARPCIQGYGGEFRAIVRANILRPSFPRIQAGRRFKQFIGLQLAANRVHCQAFAEVFISYLQDCKFPPLASLASTVSQ